MRRYWFCLGSGGEGCLNYIITLSEEKSALERDKATFTANTDPIH